MSRYRRPSRLEERGRSGQAWPTAGSRDHRAPMSTGLASPLASIAVRVDGAIRPVGGATRLVAPVAGSRLDGVPIGPASDLFSGRSFEDHPISRNILLKSPRAEGPNDPVAGMARPGPPYRPPALMSRLEGCFRVGLNTACSAVPGAGFRPEPDPDLRRRAGRGFYGRFGPDPPGGCVLLPVMFVALRFLSCAGAGAAPTGRERAAETPGQAARGYAGGPYHLPSASGCGRGRPPAAWRGALPEGGPAGRGPCWRNPCRRNPCWRGSR
jgi:hypothetical protein